MTLPRRILKGTTYILTRRCFQRKFFLRPSKLNNQIFLYCIACAAEKSGVLIHAYCVMSNHHHIVLTDPDGSLPEFTNYLHRLTALCINTSMKRWEIFWSREQCSQVSLEDDEDVLDKIVYTICNPVSAFLVDKSKKWPGLCSMPEDVLKGELVIKRPNVYFAEKGKMPDEVTLKLTRPEIYTDLDDAELVELIRRRVNEKEMDKSAEAREKQIRCLGPHRVMRQKPFHSPRTIAPHRNLKPQVAAKNKWRRIEALKRLKNWIAAYREAWKLWKQGKKDVLFPPGTYGLVQNAGVRCAET